MIKKICLAVALLIVMAVVPAKSQQVGSWSIYPVFSGNNNNSLVDTDNKVFYLADGWLLKEGIYRRRAVVQIRDYNFWRAGG